MADKTMFSVPLLYISQSQDKVDPTQQHAERFFLREWMATSSVTPSRFVFCFGDELPPRCCCASVGTTIVADLAVVRAGRQPPASVYGQCIPTHLVAPFRRTHASTVWRRSVSLLLTAVHSLIDGCSITSVPSWSHPNSNRERRILKMSVRSYVSGARVDAKIG